MTLCNPGNTHTCVVMGHLKLLQVVEIPKVVFLLSYLCSSVFTPGGHLTPWWSHDSPLVLLCCCHLRGLSECVTLVVSCRNMVSCVSVSMDGTLLLSGSHDETVRVWDIQSKQTIRCLAHKGKPAKPSDSCRESCRKCPFYHF